MSIRRKFTFLLLLIALVPLIVSRVVTASISSQASYDVADEMQKFLVDSAENSLLTATKDFSRLLDEKELNLALIVRFQAEKIEKRLASAMLAKEEKKARNQQPNESVQPIASDAITKFEDFGLDKTIEGQARYRHYCVDPSSGKKLPIEVSYQKQRCYTVGKGRDDRSELDQLKSMTAPYWNLNQMSKGTILRQYTFLESGVFTSYPFGMARTDKEVGDLRKIPVYLQVKKMKKGDIFVSPPTIEHETGLTVMLVATPLFYPDGRFAGITGLDLITKNLFDELDLPEKSWQEETTALLVKRLGPHSGLPGEIAILEKKTGSRIVRRPEEIKERQPEGMHTVDRHVRSRYLETSNPQLLNKIVDRAESGKSGIVRMPFNGKESIWAFGPAREGEEASEPFLIVIVPEKEVVAIAEKKKGQIIEFAKSERWITGVIFLVVALFAAVIGFRSAKGVTRPIGRIAEAGIQLSEGNYHARVDIRTGDELQRLGEIFNETGPKLLERESMKHSLAMAMEVQQQLLPQAPPVCEGLDVAGESIYCDETGGDYFDYLMLQGKEGDDTLRLGVAIGDVSGHGIGAALIMASVRSVLHSHAGRLQDRLDELMSLLNRSFTDGAETGRFVTFCFSLFDPEQQTLRWVSAGHDPALHMHHDPTTGEMTIDELPNSGLPLGVMDDAEYEAMGPLDLSSGDVVLFGTDGIWETSDVTGNPFGKERLRQLLLDMHDQPANAIRQAILHAVTTFRGEGPQLDDITLVVVRVE